jgi:hypothetical protein
MVAFLHSPPLVCVPSESRHRYRVGNETRQMAGLASLAAWRRLRSPQARIRRSPFFHGSWFTLLFPLSRLTSHYPMAQALTIMSSMSSSQSYSSCTQCTHAIIHPCMQISTLPPPHGFGCSKTLSPKLPKLFPCPCVFLSSPPSTS